MSERDKRKQQLFIEFISGTSRRTRIMWGTSNELFDLEITNAQREALVAIASINDCHISDIAHWLGVTNGAVTQLVDSLEKIKVVKREQDKLDARKVRVLITDLGRKKLQQTVAKYVNRFEDIFKNVTVEQLEVIIAVQNEIFSYGQKQGFKI